MPPPTRLTSADPRRGRLARLGFEDAGRAIALLEGSPLAELLERDELVEALGTAPDPDLAVRGLVALAERLDAGAADLLRALRDDVQLRTRLLLVLGSSVALGDTLTRQPDAWQDLRGEGSLPLPDLRGALLLAVGADPAAAVPVGEGAHGVDALRAAYSRLLLRIAARDLSGEADLVVTSASLADLAGGALEAALAVARSAEPQHAAARLAVIGMGKCGGRELNYVSDVDVVYVVEPAEGHEESEALRVGTRLAQALMRVCMTPSPAGSLWEVDAALRPEGKQGPLVRTLASHVAYYDRWAKTWEFQALLKARPVAGDAELGDAYCRALWPKVWEAAAREGFVADVQAMRRRVEEHIPRAEQARQLKLGRGGLRDVEFAVQLLQLVHGRADDSLRSRTTLAALAALGRGGYVAREDAGTLNTAYRFLRTLEHRIQMHRLRRTHLVPEDPADLRRIGRSFGLVGDPAEALVAEWKRQRQEVRRIHEKVFYRPLLDAVARLAPGEARLTAEAARTRLEALGYRDPAGALRHLEALTSGVSRRAAIQRTLLPVMLGWFADSPDPDGGLLAFRQVSDALGTTHWYLRDLRDEGASAERMARVLGSSRFSGDLLLRAPEAVAILGNDAELQPRSPTALLEEALATVRRHYDPTTAAAAVRGVRRRELFRTSAADVLGVLDTDVVGSALTAIAEATLAGALSAAMAFVAGERRAPLPTRIAVIGMGRLGGGEMGYGSDADVLFVHDPLPGADERDATEAAYAVANELRRILALPAPDPPLVVDADLRPEGRQGPLVRSLASYESYYRRWSLVWERQALLRARPVAGDPWLGRSFLELVEPLRHPAEGLPEADVREVRRIKARVEAERLPRGVDRSRHLKLGPGGLSDVEWTVQLLQLQHAGAVPALRTPRTLQALAAAESAELVREEDAQALRAAWLLASRIRNAVVLVRGRAGDEIPADLRHLLGVARLVLGQQASSGSLVEEYRRAARRARTAMERVFYA